MTQPDPPHALRLIERLLLICGVLALGCYGYFQAERALVQWLERGRLERAAKEQDAEEGAARKDGPIGRIEIPGAGLSAVILDGVDDRTLRRAVGHIPGTAYPGETGTIGLAGHRDTFFRALRDIRKRDVIRLVTPRETREYLVESVEVVQPSNTQVLEPAGQPRLTLVTCYPFSYIGRAPQRFVVHAREASAQEVAAARPAPRPALPRSPSPVPAKPTVPAPTVVEVAAADASAGDEFPAAAEPKKKRGKFVKSVTFPFRKAFGWMKRDPKPERPVAGEY